MLEESEKGMAENDLPESAETAEAPVRVGLALALFAAIAVLMSADLVGDAGTGAQAMHLAAEGLVMVLAATGVAALWRSFRTARARVDGLRVDLAAARVEASRYKAQAHEALQGLGQAIDAQFERWGLTGAEREVGLLLLKGLSHREVAAVRATTEPTVRQQALMIYRKSGVRGRSELSAFFLEDLLLPQGPAPDDVLPRR